MPSTVDNTSHLPALDGWRGLVIGLLLIGHFVPVPGINLGRIGVNFFFVLSGMLMAKLLFVNNVPIPTFYRRRIARIAPAHLSFIALTVATYLVLKLPIEVSEIIAATFFFNNYSVSDAMPVGHIWSLSVEEHSYILLSIVAICSRRLRRSPLVTLILLAGICGVMNFWYQSFYVSRELYNRLLHTEVAAYGIVFSAFLCVLFHKRGTPKTHAIAVPLLIFLGIVLHWWSVPGTLSQVAGVGSFALAINLLPATSMHVQKILSIGVFRQLGLWSFSLYLWQQPFYIAYWSKKMSLPISLGCALALGLASYYLVESPARRYINARWSPQRNLPIALPLRTDRIA